jgi:hypothetical protein
VARIARIAWDCFQGCMLEGDIQHSSLTVDTPASIEGVWFDCIYTHRTAPGCPFVLDPTVRIVADYPGPDRRPRIVMEDLEGAMQFRNHAPIFVSAESGATWTIDTGLTRSFLTPQAIMFNIQHMEVEQVKEQVVTDSQGRTFSYSSVVRTMLVTVKDVYGEITLCLHLPNVALLTHYPDPSVSGSLGRDWAALVQAVADRKVPVEHFDSTSHWQGGDVLSAGFGNWQLTQPQLRGHVVSVPYQQLQVFELPESHPVLSDPQCTNREMIALMENVLPTAFHLMPLAFTFEMVPQLLWVAHAAHRHHAATNDPDFSTPARRMRSIPSTLTANPLLFHHHHHYPALPANAFGDLGIDVPAPAFFLNSMSIPSSLYPFELRSPGKVLDSLRSTYHYYQAQPVPNAFILGTLRRLGEELVAFIQHQDRHHADAATYAQQLDALGIPRFNSWDCFQGCAMDNRMQRAAHCRHPPARRAAKHPRRS